MAITPEQKILIVGAGVFGVSTARTLLQQGVPAENITIIDRAPSLPAVDAAGTDINKIVRFDYEDPVYADMALRAIKELRKPEWEGVYHESGVLVIGDSAHKYFLASLKNVQSATPRHEVIQSQSTLRSLFPKATPIFPPGATAMAYLNREGGWAEAGRSVGVVIRWLREAGVQILDSQEAEKLIFSDGKKDVRGVITKAGRRFEADLVILASGAWTPPLLENAGVKMEPLLLQATGQAIAIMQLTKEEMEKHRDDPVLFDMATGFYMFPPTADGQLKFVFHKPGYLNTPAAASCSCPQTVLSPGGENGAIPKRDLAELKTLMQAFRPSLAGREIIETRLCWYIDTPDSNFLFDFHPDYPSLFLATGGSGHGYKFLPILGDYIVARINGTLAPNLVDKWAYKERKFGLEGSRTQEERRELSCETFVEKVDLAASAWIIEKSRL